MIKVILAIALFVVCVFGVVYGVVETEDQEVSENLVKLAEEVIASQERVIASQERVIASGEAQVKARDDMIKCLNGIIAEQKTLLAVKDEKFALLAGSSEVARWLCSK
jgi:uncharacterized coiled-coil protein SlyX